MITSNPYDLYGSDSESAASQGPLFNPTYRDVADEGRIQNLYARIEEAKSNGWGMRLRDWVRVHQGRVFLALAGLLVFVSAFLAIQQYPRSFPTPPKQDLAATGITAKDNVNLNLKLELDKEGAIIKQSSKDAKIEGEKNGIITKEATAGEGITHLSRRALAQRLDMLDKSLTAEQRVYAEDYVQNAIGNHWLELGDQLSFTNQLLDEAIAKSEELSDTQLQNLEQYSALVS